MMRRRFDESLSNSRQALTVINLAPRHLRNLDIPTLGRDVLSGCIGAMVQIAYCMSFSALIFQAPIAAGFPLGLAALLMGTVVTGVIVALTTTLSPATGGPDTPAVAVLSVLAASIADTLTASGVSTDIVIINVMIAITVSTVISGVFLYGLGALHLGQWLRFVPYPVVAGFLAGSGVLMVAGGAEVITQTNLTLSPASWVRLYSLAYVPQLAIGLVFALSIGVLRRWVYPYLVLPVAFVGFLVLLDLILFGVVPVQVRSVWFLPSVGKLALWWPLSSITRADIDWGGIAQSASDIGAVSWITAISMLLDVSSLEVARQKSADLDKELRTNGIANIVAGVLGGMGGNLSLNGAIMLEESGAVTKWGGVFVALTCVVVLFAGADIGTYVPKAILGGMLAYLGAMILVEVWQSPVQSSWVDWTFGIAIMLVICNFGYLQGVALGVVVACFMFALSYARIGVVRRHLTRQEFSSNVERSPKQAHLLREEGKRVHVLWLSGFIFFGSSNVVFERIREVIEQQRDKPVEYVVLDFSRVPGLDTSAVLSLVKLRDFCDWHGVALAFSGFNENMRRYFERVRFLTGGGPHQVFGTRNEALEWCEEMLLMHHEVGPAFIHSFETWLAAEFGAHSQADIARIMTYLDRHELKKGEFLFRQGEASDCIEVLASGCVAITFDDEQGRPVRLRRMIGHTTVGEMGFYRGTPRAANVIAEEPTVAYRLSKESFDRMEEEDPEAALAFHELIIRLLSDRLEFANREITALL
jgi:sulfate permease, SulP family